MWYDFKFTAIIEDRAVIERILTHMGLAAQPPNSLLCVEILEKTAGLEEIFTCFTARQAADSLRFGQKGRLK